ncbi:MAG: hypothetical protein JKY53_08015 [Flavobacteriales bacterium]|nr:hypothetical protein [Flavobacteriales bacterium]
MKKLLPFVLVALVFQGCLKDKHSEKRTYIANSPIYMTYDELANSIKIEEPRELCTPRKVYATGSYLYINELQKGIHVIDNSDPRNPKNIAFINVPGNVDITANGNYLYVDSYSDLVTFDVSDVNTIKEVCRESKVFEYILPPHNPEYPIALIDPDKGVVSGWEVMEVTETCVNGDCGQLYDVNFNTERLVLNDQAFAEAGGGLQVGKMEGVSVAGSMSRFMIYDSNLYAISSASDVAIFNVSDASCPSKSSEVEMQLGIETLFSYGENLFVGAETGMFIYDMSNPEKPEYVSTFEHVQSCDPVVVYDDKAYVTTRGTNECGGWVNQLDVVDISDINNPESIAEYWMNEPYGLGIDGQNDVLFVCDGAAGVKIFTDITGDVNSGWISDNDYTISNNGYDVIPINGQLIVIGDDGLYQYDYSNLDNIQLLSMIAVGQCEE